MLNSSMVSYCK